MSFGRAEQLTLSHEIAVDARYHVVLETDVARCHLTGVGVHPREVFRPLVRAGVHAGVRAHNHPSGSAQAGAEDLALTLRLRDAGQLVGITGSLTTS